MLTLLSSQPHKKIPAPAEPPFSQDVLGGTHSGAVPFN